MSKLRPDIEKFLIKQENRTEEINSKEEAKEKNKGFYCKNCDYGSETLKISDGSDYTTLDMTENKCPKCGGADTIVNTFSEKVKEIRDITNKYKEDWIKISSLRKESTLNDEDFEYVINSLIVRGKCYILIEEGEIIIRID